MDVLNKEDNYTISFLRHYTPQANECPGWLFEKIMHTIKIIDKLKLDNKDVELRLNAAVEEIENLKAKRMSKEHFEEVLPNPGRCRKKKTIKCYTCECGEDFYEDDTE